MAALCRLKRERERGGSRISHFTVLECDPKLRVQKPCLFFPPQELQLKNLEDDYETSKDRRENGKSET